MRRTVRLILIAVALAMGVSTFVLNLLTEINLSTALSLLSISVVCLAIVNLETK